MPTDHIQRLDSTPTTPTPLARHGSTRRTALVCGLAVLGAAVSAHAAPQGSVRRINLSTSGAQANGKSERLAISADGRFVAFESAASSLVAGDQNGKTDIFVNELATGITTRVSVNSSGQGAKDVSGGATISSDGRYVSFCSRADNLVPGDTGGFFDIFVRDRNAGTTSRVSVDSNGMQGNGDCSVGLYISTSNAISGDGRFVAFHSHATNLVLGDTNGVADVFVHDRQTGATTRVSVSSSGAEGNGESLWPTISADGRYVAFASEAGNLISNDTNAWADSFVHDRLTGTTTRVSVSSIGGQAHLGSYSGVLSGNGRFVGFTSNSSNLVPGDNNGTYDSFVRDLSTGMTELVSRSSTGVLGNLASGPPFFSADGRYVAFQSAADNLVPGDTNGMTDFFVRDRLTGATTRASIGANGAQGNSNSFTVHSTPLTADGSIVAFVSGASNLVPGDTNDVWDIFVYQRAPGTPTHYCTAKTNSKGCVPALATSGTARASGPVPFTITAVNVLNNKRGILLYGLGPSGAPFHGGTLCAAAPVSRTPVQNSAGNPPPDDCSGVLSMDFNARILSGVDPRLVPGTVVYAQFVHDDPASAGALGLTDAIEFTIEP